MTQASWKNREDRQPVYRVGNMHDCPPIGGAIFIACQMAVKFTHRAPTVADLRAQFGMSRATAYRWRNAWRAANGLHA